MVTLGLTGGIGMGKSTLGQILSEWSIQVIDTDDIAREIVQPGQPLLSDLEEEFGPSIIQANGELDRKALADIVFKDKEALNTLNSFMHPCIRQKWKQQLAAWKENGEQLACVIIPLLFEIQVHLEFDKIVCVACSNSSQYQRLKSRNWTDDQIKSRIGSQLSIQEKMKLSHFVLWTDTSIELTKHQMASIKNRLAI